MHEGGPSVPATSPVFVDSSGRRGRWLHRLFVALGLLMSAYVAVVFLALIGPSSLSRLAVPGLGPVLPGSGAPGLRTATGGHAKPATVLSPRPQPTRGAGSTVSPSAPPAFRRPTPFPSPTPAAAATSPQPTSRPTTAASPPATGRPATPGPRSSQTPPGQASSHPSPHSSHAKGGSPQPSPSP